MNIKHFHHRFFLLCFAFELWTQQFTRFIFYCCRFLLEWHLNGIRTSSVLCDNASGNVGDYVANVSNKRTQFILDVVRLYQNVSSHCTLTPLNKKFNSTGKQKIHHLKWFYMWIYLGQAKKYFFIWILPFFPLKEPSECVIKTLLDSISALIFRNPLFDNLN